jgi:hypothetical protein
VSRPLQVFIALLALVVVSGLPTVAAAAMNIDGCAEECASEAASDAPEQQQNNCPDECPMGCPPFCHACACFSPLASAEPPAVLAVPAPATESVVVAHEYQLPPSLPPPGVFHPPRSAS